MQQNRRHDAVPTSRVIGTETVLAFSPSNRPICDVSKPPECAENYALFSD